MITDPQIIVAVGTPLYLLFMLVFIIAAKLIGKPQPGGIYVPVNGRLRVMTEQEYHELFEFIAVHDKDRAALEAARVERWLDETAPMRRIVIPSATSATSATRERHAA